MTGALIKEHLFYITAKWLNRAFSLLPGSGDGNLDTSH